MFFSFVTGSEQSTYLFLMFEVLDHGIVKLKLLNAS